MFCGVFLVEHVNEYCNVMIPSITNSSSHSFKQGKVKHDSFELIPHSHESKDKAIQFLMLLFLHSIYTY